VTETVQAVAATAGIIVKKYVGRPPKASKALVTAAMDEKRVLRRRKIIKSQYIRNIIC